MDNRIVVCMLPDLLFVQVPSPNKNIYNEKGSLKNGRVAMRRKIKS